MNRVSAVLLIGSLLVGCATSGNRIDMAKLSQFKEGVTTEKEVVASLGNPEFKSLTSDGKTLATYFYTKVENKPETFIPIVGGVLVGGMKMNQQTVQFLFDKNGVLEKYITNETNQDMNTGLLNRGRETRR